MIVRRAAPGLRPTGQGHGGLECPTPLRYGRMMIDLHAHSTESDGSDSPAELMALASRVGLSAIALTDHDTVDGLAEARAAAAGYGVRLIQGCELSCEVGKSTM